MAFVMVLSYSRRIFLRFFLDARMDSFLRGHVEAFAAFGGVARVLLYDNLKSAVLERVGDADPLQPAVAGSSPRTTASSRARWPWPAEMRRVAWSAASATSARPSSPRASSPTWTI